MWVSRGYTMTLDEYKDKTQAMQKRHTIELKRLAVEYVHTNNSVSIGDLVRDHIGTIKVRVVLVSGLQHPECVYRGVQYTTRGIAFKAGKERDVYQSNLLGT